jgi:hypothetical protein
MSTSVINRIISLLTAVVLLAAAADQLGAAGYGTVRGKLLRQGRSATYPVAGIEVSLYAVDSKLGRSPKATSGSDGMYYVRNVPPGKYRLEIWIGKSPRTYDVAVRGTGYTDVAPIVVP